MAQQLTVVEATPTLHPDMSVREILSAVAAGVVTGRCVERGGEWINLWYRPDGEVAATPWCPTGRRLQHLSDRDFTIVRTSGAVELTTLGWKWLERLVRPLTADEAQQRSQAFLPRDPWTVMRWRYIGSPKSARCFRIGGPREPRCARRRTA